MRTSALFQGSCAALQVYLHPYQAASQFQSGVGREPTQVLYTIMAATPVAVKSIIIITPIRNHCTPRHQVSTLLHRIDTMHS
jgi:hypothetical protein